MTRSEIRAAMAEVASVVAMLETAMHGASLGGQRHLSMPLHRAKQRLRELDSLLQREDVGPDPVEAAQRLAAEVARLQPSRSAAFALAVVDAARVVLAETTFGRIAARAHASKGPK